MCPGHDQSHGNWIISCLTVWAQWDEGNIPQSRCSTTYKQETDRHHITTENTMWNQDELTHAIFWGPRFLTESGATKPAAMRRIWNSCRELTRRKRELVSFHLGTWNSPHHRCTAVMAFTCWGWRASAWGVFCKVKSRGHQYGFLKGWNLTWRGEGSAWKNSPSGRGNSV